jgi:hypothetical protein
MSGQRKINKKPAAAWRLAWGPDFLAEPTERAPRTHQRQVR